MTNYWEPGTQYNNGDVVEYNGHRYKIIQPHRSQGDWTPDITPALWGRLQDGDHSGGGQHHQGGGTAPPPEPTHTQQSRPDTQGDQKPWDQHDTQKVEIHDHEKKKDWWDIPEDRRQQLEVGGGLVAGLGILAGGYAAYKHHEKNEEEKKAQIWSLQNWVTDAQRRTADFHQNGPRGPIAWIYSEGKNFPQGAIPGGEEKGNPQYIIRAFYEGGIHVGKGGNFKKAAAIAYGGDEVPLDVYEILVGNQGAVRWVDVQGTFSPEVLRGARPVEGGKEKNGTDVYIAQVPYKGGVHVGKVEQGFKGAHIAYGGDEKTVDVYRVLCYA